jgi:hypothetical protein
VSPGPYRPRCMSEAHADGQAGAPNFGLPGRPRMIARVEVVRIMVGRSCYSVRRTPPHRSRRRAPRRDGGQPNKWATRSDLLAQIVRSGPAPDGPAWKLPRMHVALGRPPHADRSRRTGDGPDYGSRRG